VGALPVVVDSKLAGILSYVDVLRAARSSLAE
jgi:CBS domain-containing protein